MKTEQLVAVAIRFFVIYLLLTVIFQYGMTLAALVMQNQRIGIAGNEVIIATFAVVLVLLAMIWAGAARLARRIIPGETAASATPVSIDRLEVVLLSLLGAWLAFSSLPDIVRYGVYIVSVDAASRRTEVGLYGHLAQLGVGMWLLLGSGGIARCLRRLRGCEK